MNAQVLSFGLGTISLLIALYMTVIKAPNAPRRAYYWCMALVSASFGLGAMVRVFQHTGPSLPLLLVLTSATFTASAAIFVGTLSRLRKA